MILEECGAEHDVVRYDRCKRARITALTLSVRKHPLLAELLPARTTDAVNCNASSGVGFTLELPPDIELKLQAQGESRDVSIQDYAREILTREATPAGKPRRTGQQ